MFDENSDLETEIKRAIRNEIENSHKNHNVALKIQTRKTSSKGSDDKV